MRNFLSVFFVFLIGFLYFCTQLQGMKPAREKIRILNK